MKLKRQLGCVLAVLALSAVSANAAEWFANAVSAAIGAEGDGWTVTTGSWEWNTTYGTLVDWTENGGLKFAPTASAAVSAADTTVITQVKFTALDATDLEVGKAVPDELTTELTGAKAGLTVVQTDADTYKYYGIVSVNASGDRGWKALTGTPDLTKAVTVKVAIYKDADNDTFVKYSVDDVVLGLETAEEGVSFAIPADYSFSSITYKGQCDLYSLAGKTYSTAANVVVNDTVAVPTIQGESVPASVSFDRTDLRVCGVDVDNEAKVAEYMASTRGNGLRGWAAAALGVYDADLIISNVVDSTSVEVGLDIAPADMNTVKYVIDGGAATTSATIAIDDTKANNTKVHTVEVQVSGITVTNLTVGVIETGKDTTKLEAGTKTFDIVAVPWESYDGNAIKVAELLNTSKLTEGDVLYVWNTLANVYDKYSLNASKTWDVVAQTQVTRSGEETVETKAADKREIERGTAIWIERDPSSRLIFAGKADLEPAVSDRTVAIAAGGENGEWTLVANPSVKAFELTAAPVDGVGIAAPVAGDVVVVEDIADPRRYEFDGTTWGYNKKVQVKMPGGRLIAKTSRVTDDNIVPAGIGFWYVRAANAAATTITFPDNKVSVTTPAE